jgi:bis(5'-nucleosyl)-tetraphosphatase (symmetrical)
MPANRPNALVPFAIGDLQGCADSLDDLVTNQLPANTPLRFVGDLVNRGPASARTLRTVMTMGSRADSVLGNHDIHLLAVAAGVRKCGKNDTLNDILTAHDREEMLEWLRFRPLALPQGEYLLVHAGVLPQWSVQQTLELAHEVEQKLRGPGWQAFLADIFGNKADRWDDGLRGIARHRVVVNALTRLRFCSVDGVMDFETKDGADGAPPGFMPWFDVPDRRTASATMVCGHWSTLGLVMRPNLLALDTGCVWGGKLTAVSLADAPEERKLVQVQCGQHCDPLM